MQKNTCHLTTYRVVTYRKYLGGYIGTFYKTINQTTAKDKKSVIIFS